MAMMTMKHINLLYLYPTLLVVHYVFGLCESMQRPEGLEDRFDLESFSESNETSLSVYFFPCIFAFNP